MRNTFSEHYHLTQEEFKSLWNNCLFCFDTNVLLDIYRYTPDTRDRLLTVLVELQDRIWIPFQVGKEFHENRLSVIRSQEVPYDQISSRVSKAVEDLKTKLSDLSLEGRKPHPFIDIHMIYGILENTVDQVEITLQNTRESHPSFLHDDPLLARLSELFDGKVGESYEQNDLDKKYDEIEIRYKHKIPPGYEDLGQKEPPVKGGSDPRAYGDAIFWYQILDFTEQHERPIILVTGDIKEDWWLRIGGKILGPRPELIKEMKQNAGVNYYQYVTDRFLEQAEAYLEIDPQPHAIDEIRDLRLQDEESAVTKALHLAERIVELARIQKRLEDQVEGTETRLEGLEQELGQKYITNDQALLISQAVKTVAMKLSKVSGRNEYGGVYGELYRKYEITSYKQLPAAKFDEAANWLNNWRESIEGDSPF